MSKILFLDVDGVICTRRSHLAFGKEGSGWFHWDPVGCAAIIKACAKGVRLVVSSTWRKDMHKDELDANFKTHGFLPEYLHPDWRTRDLMRGRGADIDDWLARHPEIQNYKILDDDSDMLEHQLSHFIQTDGEEGMTSDNIKKLLNWSGALKS